MSSCRDPAQERQAKALMETIRCLVCQGQSVADSDAEMAGDMRSMIRERIQAGEDPEAIRAWLISRYGDWISYRAGIRWLTCAALRGAARCCSLGGLWLARGRFRRRKEALMGGWLAMILLALAVAAGLYPFARRDKGALQFLAAALLLALAGYGWQGRPDRARQPEDRRAAAARSARRRFRDPAPAICSAAFDRASYWMTLADADRRRGNPHGAAEILESAVRRQSAQLRLVDRLRLCAGRRRATMR